MKVQDSNLTGTSPAAANPPGSVARPTGFGASPAGKPGAGDRVEFSGIAGKLGATLAAQSAERARRVASLERAYQAGRYTTDAHAISRALVSETLGATAADKSA